MSGGDWQVGDLALCINARAIRNPDQSVSLGTGLRSGAIYTVERVGQNLNGHLALWFSDLRCDEPYGKRASRFIKVTPPEADEFDRETIRLMRGETVREKVNG